MGCTSLYGIHVGVLVLEQVRSLCALAKAHNFLPQNKVLNNRVSTVVSTKPSLIFCPKQCAETEGVVPCRVSVYLSFSPCPNQELGPPFLFTFSSIRLVVCCSLVLTVFVRTCSKTLL